MLGVVSFLKLKDNFLGEVVFDFNFVANDPYFTDSNFLFFCILANICE